MKRIVRLTIILIIALYLLMACSKKEDKEMQSVPETDQVTLIEDKKKHSDTPLEEERMDIQIWTVNDLKYMDEENHMTNYLEAKYQVTIEYLPRPVSDADWGVKVRLDLSSGNPPDHFSDVTPQDYEKYFNQGIIREIPEDDINIYAADYMAWITQHLGECPFQNVRDSEGKIFAMPKPWTPASSARVLAYRKDWAENVGVTTAPRDLVELEELFIKLSKDDPDGNNQDDTYAITASGVHVDRLMESFGFVFGAYNVYPGIFTVNSGRVIRGELEVGAKEALTTLNRWYEMGLIDPDFMVNKPVNFDEAIYTGKAAGGVWSWYQFVPEGVFHGGKYYEYFNGKVEFEILEAPVGPDGYSGYIEPSPYLNVGLIFFNHVSDNQLKKYLQIFNDGAFDLETHLNIQRGIEGVTYKKVTDVHGEVFYEWLPPYDTKEARYEFGTGGLATIGTWWNDYDFQEPFIVAPEFREMNKELSTRSAGRYDELITISKPIYNEYKEKLDQLLAENYIEFIVGLRPLDEYDAFVEEYKAAGADKIMEEAQALYDQFNKIGN
ncbi:type 2 periplasmic-binding domain-containing protein [Vallitalea okinawensis]|uniref:hypothetical protein n=1 Tax=Vallitalea okinawensis TaxID=2078660 RepID=UPI000CFD28B3|nr:hypothetical protein [Vallitalea okinawensis]